MSRDNIHTCGYKKDMGMALKNYTWGHRCITQNGHESVSTWVFHRMCDGVSVPCTITSQRNDGLVSLSHDGYDAPYVILRDRVP